MTTANVTQNEVYVLSADGTHSLAATDSTYQWNDASWRRFTQDWASGTRTVLPPPSKGGAANVAYNMDDPYGNMKGLLRNPVSISDMSSAGGLQPFIQVAKTGGTSVPTINIRRITLRLRQMP
jgi:hypothetical protein